jgi:chromosome segregation ATPase
VIEQGLYFALGFLVCALLALATMPAVWRRAHRLVRRDLEAALPISPREIAAERDQLRARFAVEYRQRELAAEKAEALRQRAMLETGEKRVEIAKLGDTVTERDASIAALTSERDGLSASLEATRKALDETTGALKARTDEYEVLGARHAGLEAAYAGLNDLSDQRRVEIAARDTNLEAQRARIDEIDAAMKKARAEARSLSEQLRQTERRLRDVETERDIAHKKGMIAESEVARREAVIAERDAAIGGLIEKRDELQAAVRAAEAARRDSLARIDMLQGELEGRDQAMARLREDTRNTAQDLARSIEKLRADKRKLAEELEVARERLAEAKQDKAPVPRRTSPARTDLRRPPPRSAADPAT